MVKTKQQTAISSLLSEEKRLKDSFQYAVGIDEAGRGPLAGPVVCAACIIYTNENRNTSNKDDVNKMNSLLEQLDCVADSKVLTEEKREELYEILVNAGKYVKYGVSIIDNNEIDRINILEATMMGMRNAVLDLLKRNNDVNKDQCFGLIDGNRIPQLMPIQSKYVIKGDGSVFSIAAASIIAKVTRDRIMIKLDKQYPQYNLAQHKGYPTFEHRQLLMIHGPSDIHRYSYNPVRDAAIKFGIKFRCEYKERKEAEEKAKTNANIKENIAKGRKKVASNKTSPSKSNKSSSSIKSNKKPVKVIKKVIVESVGTRRSTRLKT